VQLTPQTPDASPLRKVLPGDWLVCFAVKEEAQAFVAKKARKVRTLVTGMGRSNAEGQVRAFIQKTKPALVLTCGFAGGLDPALEKGAILFEADPQSPIVPYLSTTGAKPAKFYCADHVAVMAQEKRGLRQASGADAVDMESSHIRGICREAGTPSATVHVILDRADEDLPMDFNQLMNADYSLSFTKLALLLIRSPGKIKQLLALQKQSRDAAERLAVVLEQFTA
jgi:adenosylhomocysteine nucleosidase